MTTPATISDTLLELISSQRFAAYVRATGGDRARAVGALPGGTGSSPAPSNEVLQYVEVLFRNALHH